MKNRLLLLSLFAFFALGVLGQNTTYTVKGMLVDSLTQEAEPYATIKIATKNNPDKAVKMAVTDMNGGFNESFATASGEYTIHITSIGKSPVVRHFSLATEKVVDLGTLYSAEATNELGAVEIVAQKPLVKVDLDKIEYNIQDDPDSQTNSLLEMLKKVPMVTVDGEDNIKVNGSSSFKVHVNGRPNNMMSDNPTEVLKSIPANSIKHIEVITNPGAKYDAEGIGGILNIVTIGGGFEGYTATFSANGGNNGGGGSVYATIKKNKLTFTVNYSLNSVKQPKSFINNLRENIDENGNVEKEIGMQGYLKNKNTFQWGNVEASYEIDTLRLITLSAGVFGGNNNSNGENQFWMADVPLTESSYDYRYGSESRNKNGWYSIRGNLDYQRVSSRNKERMFTLSYNVNARPSNTDGYTNYNYTPQELSPQWEELLQLNNLQLDGKQKTIEQTVQADYTTPIGKNNTIEGGAKYILRNNTSEDWRYEQTATGAYNLDLDRSSHYKHLNDILAAYLGYSVKVNQFSGKAGVRYEHTMQHVKFLVGKGEDFKVNFNDVVPSATVGYKLNDMSNLRLGYNMRIWRPGIWYLNPYVNDANPTSISKGNPDLESEKSHAVTLSYSNFTQKFNMNFSLRYSFNNNGIQQVSRLVKTGEIVPELNNEVAGHEFLFSTYENIGKSKVAGLDGYVNWNASPKTRIYVNFNLNYSELRSPAQNLKNSGWSIFAYGGIQQTLPYDIRATLNVMGATPTINLQGKGSSFYNYQISINKSFLKEKRLTASIFASNFINKYMHYKQTVDGEGFRNTLDNKYSRMRYGASISYRIGELKASVKKASRTIHNDDVKSEGSEGGGSSN